MLSKELGELLIQPILLLISFFLGRYTSYRADCRAAMKEMNEQVYRPFIALYENRHHAYAMRIVDFPLEEQEELLRLLLVNQTSFSPMMQKKILHFDMIFSGYSEILRNGEQLLEEEMEEVENAFTGILLRMQRQYKRNSRRLYCTFPKRVWYCICDAGYWIRTRFLIGFGIK